MKIQQINFTHKYKLRRALLSYNSKEAQLTFGPLTNEVFILFATVGKIPTISQNFGAFVFSNITWYFAQPLAGNRTVKRCSIAPWIFTFLKTISQSNPNGSAFERRRQVINKPHFSFIRYAHKVSSKPRTNPWSRRPNKFPRITELIYNLVAGAFKFFPVSRTI